MQVRLQSSNISTGLLTKFIENIWQDVNEKYSEHVVEISGVNSFAGLNKNGFPYKKTVAYYRHFLKLPNVIPAFTCKLAALVQDD